MIGLLRAEWLKATRQGMSRVVAALLLVFSALIPLALVLTVLGKGPQTSLQKSYDQLAFPQNILTSLGVISNIGFLIVAVLISAVVGSEYGLDTWKNLLIRKPGRARFILAKLAVTWPLLIAAFLTMLAVAQGLALVGQALVAPTATSLGLTTNSLTADQFLAAFNPQAVYLLIDFAITASLAIFFTVLGRSSVAGVLITLVWTIGDGVSTRLLPDALSQFSFQKNLNSLTSNMQKSGSGPIETWQSLLLLAVYFAIPLVAGLVIFQRRDMAGN